MAKEEVLERECPFLQSSKMVLKCSSHLFSDMGIMKCNESSEKYCIRVLEEETRMEQN